MKMMIKSKRYLIYKHKFKKHSFSSIFMMKSLTVSIGFQIRKGESIMIPIQCIHRDSEYYENPEKFDPERFSEENRHKIKPMTYMPFGAGPRNCIGEFSFLQYDVQFLF